MARTDQLESHTTGFSYLFKSIKFIVTPASETYRKVILSVVSLFTASSPNTMMQWEQNPYSWAPTPDSDPNHHPSYWQGRDRYHQTLTSIGVCPVIFRLKGFNVLREQCTHGSVETQTFFFLFSLQCNRKSVRVSRQSRSTRQRFLRPIHDMYSPGSSSSPASSPAWSSPAPPGPPPAASSMYCA